MIQGLALSVCTLQSKASISGRNPKTTIALVIPNSFQLSGSTTIQRLDWPEEVIKCSYYRAPDNYLKRHCSFFQKNFDNNRIYLGNDNKVSVGPYTPVARSVNMRREKPGQESIANTEK